MKNFTKVETITSPKLVISYDESPESPREWSNLGYFITKDNNYVSPDQDDVWEDIIASTGQVAQSQEEHIDLIKKGIEEQGEKVLAIYPICKYEHSGVSYSLGEKHGFDFSNNGFYIITVKSQAETGTAEEDFEKAIKAELEIYNKYANGEVYYFILYNDKGEMEDSCSGLYDLEDIKDMLPEEWKDEDLAQYIKE